MQNAKDESSWRSLGTLFEIDLKDLTLVDKKDDDETTVDMPLAKGTNVGSNSEDVEGSYATKDFAKSLGLNLDWFHLAGEREKEEQRGRQQAAQRAALKRLGARIKVMPPEKQKNALQRLVSLVKGEAIDHASLVTLLEIDLKDLPIRVVDGKVKLAREKKPSLEPLPDEPKRDRGKEFDDAVEVLSKAEESNEDFWGPIANVLLGFSRENRDGDYDGYERPPPHLKKAFQRESRDLCELLFGRRGEPASLEEEVSRAIVEASGDLEDQSVSPALRDALAARQETGDKQRVGQDWTELSALLAKFPTLYDAAVGLAKEPAYGAYSRAGALLKGLKGMADQVAAADQKQKPIAIDKTNKQATAAFKQVADAAKSDGAALDRLKSQDDFLDTAKHVDQLNGTVPQRASELLNGFVNVKPQNVKR